MLAAGAMRVLGEEWEIGYRGEERRLDSPAETERKKKRKKKKGGIRPGSCGKAGKHRRR